MLDLRAVVILETMPPSLPKNRSAVNKAKIRFVSARAVTIKFLGKFDPTLRLMGTE